MPALDDPLVEVLHRREGVPLDQAAATLRRQEVATDLIEFAAERFPTQFAGAWFDHQAGGRLVLRIQGVTDASRELLLAGYPFKEHVVVQSAPRSMLDLEAFRERAIEDTDELVQRGIEVGAIAISVPDNAVLFRVHGDLDVASRLLRQFYAEVDPGMFAVDEYDLGELHYAAGTCSTRYACHTTSPGFGPLRGGLHAYPPGGAGACTLSYSAFNAQGARYVLAAGHCAIPGESWYHNTSHNYRIGGVPASVTPCHPSQGCRHTSLTPNHFDGARIYISPGTWNTSYYLWASGSAQILQVRGVRGLTIISKGHMVCISGAASNSHIDSCGTISDVRLDTGAGLTDAFRVRGCSRSGDSGAPVYSRYNSTVANHFAYGILSLASRTICPYSGPEDDSYAAYAIYTTAELNVTIHTTANQP